MAVALARTVAAAVAGLASTGMGLRRGRRTRLRIAGLGGDSSAVSRGSESEGTWRTRAVGAVFALGAGSMLASVLIAAARPHDVGSLAIRTVFSRACHQNPERSFAWAGEPFCICHRCFGIYAGLAVGALVAALWPRLPLDPGSRRVWSVALVPMLVHVALLNLWSPADLVFLRVGTGALFGLWGGFAASVALGQATTPRPLPRLETTT